ncbi:TPA: winged helix-turn-helix domain-containing protein [Enterobacter asburiae]|nr:winged helix-turn-helix domain-containing protein [Enterobacter asburiae]
MNYLIDNSILFSPDKKTISSRKNPFISISLTTTATRLLDELVRKPEEVLTRAFLLKTVWEDNGYASSDASLNNNISLLRKNFATVSDTEVELKTIPKIGFQLNATVEVVDDVSPDDTESDTATLAEKIKGNGTSNKFAIALYLLASAAVMTAVILFFLNKNNDIRFKKIDAMRVEQLGKCDVFNMSSIPVNFANVLEIYPEIKTKCEGNQASVYYDFSDMTKDRTKNLFVAICYQSKISGYQKCENLKSYSQQ